MADREGQNGGHHDMNGDAPEAPEDALEGFVAECFEDLKPMPKSVFPFHFICSELGGHCDRFRSLHGRPGQPPCGGIFSVQAGAGQQAHQASPPANHQVATFLELFIDLSCFSPVFDQGGVSVKPVQSVTVACVTDWCTCF